MPIIKPAGSATGATAPRLTTTIVVCAYLAGFAAMLFEAAWLRQFAVVFGNSPLAFLAVLTAYLAGLFTGAALAARYVGKIARPIQIFGRVQGIVAAAAVAVPLVLVVVGAAYISMLGGQAAPANAGGWAPAAFHLLATFLVLVVPAAGMGAALPLLARGGIDREAAIGPTVATLWGAHAFGGACGVLTAGYVSLPLIGLNGTIAAGVVVSLLIVGLIAILAPRGAAATPAVTPGPAPSFYRACIEPWISAQRRRGGGFASAWSAQPAWILPATLIGGAAAMTYLLLWVRLLSHVLGQDVYAFSIVLTIFLGGIAIGSGIAAKFARDGLAAATAYIGVQCAAGVLAISTYTMLDPLLPSARGMAQVVAYALAIVLPAAIFLGASLPLAVRVLASGVARAGNDTARIYAWATAGAIAGTLCAGLLLLPSAGFEGTIKLAAAANFGLACWVAIFVARRRPIAIGLTACATLATIVIYAPTRPATLTSTAIIPAAYEAGAQELFYAVGRAATVRMLAADGFYYLGSDGLPAAAIGASGSPPRQDPAKWLATLPVAARPGAQAVLLIGLRGGVTLDGMPPSVRGVDVVELEPEIVNANKTIAARRGNDPLQDSRFTMIVNDARDAMRLTDKRYDIIIAEASPPWTSRASHLYTREFLAEIRTHLTDGGVFVQSIATEYFDAALLRSAAATLLSEFEYVRMYRPAPRRLIFLASATLLEPELQLARSGAPITDDVMHYSRMGMNGVEDLVAALAMETAGVAAFAGDATVSTDDNLLLAMRSRRRADGLDAAELANLVAPHDPLLRRESFIYTRLADRIDFGYVMRRLIGTDQQARAVNVAATHPVESTRLLMYGLLYAARDQPEQAATAFRAALDQRPGNAQARYLLIAPDIAQLAQATAGPELTALAEALPASANAVVQAWRFAASQDWQSLAQLDGALGRASVTDAWYPDVVRLRAEWRGKVTQNIESFAFDALRLIDRAILLAPDRNLFLLRAAIGIALGDGGIAIESSRQVVRLLRADLEEIQATGGILSGRELIIMRQNLSAIVTNLSGDLVAGENRRAESVTRAANEILRFLDTAEATTEQ